MAGWKRGQIGRKPRQPRGRPGRLGRRAGRGHQERDYAVPLADRAGTLAAVRDLLHRLPETSAAEFTLPLVTVALRAVRRP